MWVALSLVFTLSMQVPSSSEGSFRPGPASAPEFEEGKRLYFDLEYELAVFRFRHASRDVELPPKERALVYAWLGLAYAQVAEMESATEAFEAAAALDGDVVLPREASPPPKALQLLEEARQRAANKPPAAVAPVEPAVPTTTAAPGSEPVAEEGGGVGTLLLAGGGAFAGLGVLALGAGAALGVLALNAADAGNASEFQDDASGFKEQAEGSALAANVSYVVGGALVAVGLAALGAGLVLE